MFQLVWHQNRNATKGGGNGNGGGSNKTISKRPVFLVFCSIPLIMLDNVDTFCKTANDWKVEFYVS